MVKMGSLQWFGANENGTDSLDSFLLERKLMKEEHLGRGGGGCVDSK